MSWIAETDMVKNLSKCYSIDRCAFNLDEITCDSLGVFPILGALRVWDFEGSSRGVSLSLVYMQRKGF